MTYVVLYPDMPPGSKIEIGDWPVQIVSPPRIEYPTVSRHYEIWAVRDLDSASGTFVSCTGNPGEEPRVLGEEFTLQNNSIVRCGPAAYTLLQEGGRV